MSRIVAILTAVKFVKSCSVKSTGYTAKRAGNVRVFQGITDGTTQFSNSLIRLVGLAVDEQINAFCELKLVRE